MFIVAEVTPTSQAITFAIIGAIVTLMTLVLQNRGKHQAAKLLAEQRAFELDERRKERAEEEAIRVSREQREWDRQDQLEARVIARSKDIADKLEDNDAKTTVKLREIKDVADTVHTLVNSNMTASMQSDLDANKRDLVSMRRIITLTKDAGEIPLQEDMDAIIATESKIRELSAAIVDRLEAVKLSQLQKEHRSDPMEQAATAAAEAARAMAIATRSDPSQDTNQPHETVIDQSALPPTTELRPT